MRRRRGFSVVEVLLASTLAAMLLSAVVAGLMLCSTSVKTNESTMRARQSASRALELILTKVRRAKEVFLLNPTGGDGYAKLATVDDGVWDGTTFTSPVMSEFVFENGKLYIIRDIDGVESKQPILSNVENMAFRSTRANTSEPWRDVTVEISMSVVQAFTATEKAQFAISGSSSVRSLEAH